MQIFLSAGLHKRSFNGRLLC